jgi:DNA-binding XRE family transcriptional regulator
MVADRKVFTGTPTQIVQRMRELDHRAYDSLEAYIQNCCSRLKDLDIEILISGQTEEERCLSFLRGLVEKGYAKLDVGSPEWIDKFAVNLLRSVLGISQEKFAREVGVAFSTVNRWERGRTQLSSAAIAHTVSRIAKKFST